MAQQDTGLGWSAKDGWLMSVAGTVAGISSSTGGYELPVIPNASYADIMAEGPWGYYRPSRNDGVKFVAEQPLVFGFAWNDGTYLRPCAIAYGANKTIRYCVSWSTTPSTQEVNDPVPNRPGWYSYRSGNSAQLSNNPTTDLPVIQASTFDIASQTAVDAITISTQNINKLNPGVCVACVAKWYTLEGTAFLSPVLISSVSEYVIMTLDGTTPHPNFAINSFILDGVRFYMGTVSGINPDSTITTMLQTPDLTPFAAAAPSKVFALIANESFSNILITETVDPYDPFGNTGEDGGEPDPDPDDDDIEEDDLPTLSFADAGFCRIYSPSLVQLDSLSNYLWTDQTFLQTVINHLKQIIENPIDAIISLSLVPCVPPTSSSEEVKVMFIPTGVYMPPVTNQFVEVDCGTFTLKEMYGSALDYNPYTGVQLYLPYVGIVQLDTDEVMGKTIHVKYRIDVVTGVCCAYVKAGADVLYQFSGHCSIQQPITSADFSGYINAVLAAGKLVASIAAAGAGAPEVAASLVGAPTPSVTSTSSDTRTTARNAATGRQITAGTEHVETKTEHSGAAFGEVAAKGISNTVGAVMNSKTIVQHSGGFSGNSGYLAAVRRPYLIVTRPRIANPEQYAQFNGRPSMIYLNLGSCTGYTQVQSVHLTGIDATNPELSEIATLLTSGVIF